MDHYKARIPRNTDRDRRAVGVWLSEKEWNQLDGIARQKEWSMAMVVSQIMRLALREGGERAAGAAVASDIKAMLEKGIAEARS